MLLFRPETSAYQTTKLGQDKGNLSFCMADRKIVLRQTISYSCIESIEFPRSIGVVLPAERILPDANNSQISFNKNFNDWEVYLIYLLLSFIFYVLLTGQKTCKWRYTHQKCYF
jgi:hypothetical protein